MNNRMLAIIAFAMILIIFMGCSSEATDEPDNDVVEETDKTEPEEQTKVEDTEEPEEESESEEAEQEEPDVSLGDYEVYIGGEIIEEEGKVIINGESNLLPNARVVGEVSVGEEEDPLFFADTSELVAEDGTFYMEIAHHDLDEETEVAVRFHFDGQQDDNITRHYGDRGQKIIGPYIYKHQGEIGGSGPKNIYQQGKVIATFDKSEEMSIRQFKEPEWYPIPEDMGDPRVWIEVEEVNNDEEHFYIHGRSNLIEGSYIDVHHQYQESGTRVLPDGSFNFKFPYEYKEDVRFFIEFQPKAWQQWNAAKEAYGAKGQNLVGDLVVDNIYGDDQLIQKDIEKEAREINVPDNVELTIEGTEVTMLVPDSVLFDFDKFELKDASKEVLTEIGETLDALEQEDLDIQINGYTDNIGNEKYNLELSENRAEEVKIFLGDQVTAKNISFTTEGFGAVNPIASNNNEKGQAKNRRVEIVINLR